MRGDAGFMALSIAGCGGGSSETTAAAGGDSAETTAAAGGDETEAAAESTGEQKVIRFMHRFPDEPYNSFTRQSSTSMRSPIRILSLRFPAPRIRSIRRESRSW